MIYRGAMTKTKLRGCFDGKVLVLDQPADLPINRPLLIEVSPEPPPTADAMLLEGLIGLASQFPATGLPADAAAQHDHYLYGTAKRP